MEYLVLEGVDLAIEVIWNAWIIMNEHDDTEDNDDNDDDNSSSTNRNFIVIVEEGWNFHWFWSCW